nr:hypothetical protein [Tanacetum cinerariifolium]
WLRHHSPTPQGAIVVAVPSSDCHHDGGRDRGFSKFHRDGGGQSTTYSPTTAATAVGKAVVVAAVVVAVVLGRVMGGGCWLPWRGYGDGKMAGRNSGAGGK